VKFDPITNQPTHADNGRYPRSNFNTALESFLSVFIVLANDGWTKIFFDYYRATNPIGATLFFLFILFLGQFMLLNLFIAILIENFEQLSVRHNFSKQLRKIKSAAIHKIIWNWLVKCGRKKIKPVLVKMELTEDETAEIKALKDLRRQ
jgi:predicted membrane protein